MKSVLISKAALVVPVLLMLLLVPVQTYAAGFAKDALFLSKSPVTEGEVVLIHTVISNDTATKFDGEVVFVDAGNKIGTVAITLTPGGAQAVSVSWKPTAGSHIVSADLTNKDGTIAEEKSATFTIVEKPKPISTVTNTAAVDSSDAIQQHIADISPTAADISQPVFTVLDSGRTKATQLLDQGIAWTKQQATTKKPGSVLGAETSTSVGSILDTVWSIVTSILLFILTSLRYIFSSAGTFYPVFAIVFLYTLWRIFKRIRRPSQE